MDVYFYGKVREIDSIITYFEANDIKIKGILVKDYTERYRTVDIEAFTIEELSEAEKDKAIIIGMLPYSYNNIGWIERKLKLPGIKNRLYKKSINDWLSQNGIIHSYFIKGNELMDIYGFTDVWNHWGRIGYYKKHIDDLKQTYELLSDDISKKVMKEFIRVYMQSGCFKMAECDGRNKYFAGYSLNGYDEELYEHRKDEIWVNCGASVGDNIFLFFSRGYTAKKIYAFEGSDKIYSRLCNNINRLPEDFRKIVIPVNMLISKKMYS